MISRDEVTHLAGLARIALKTDEIDHLATQLDVILGAVAKVQEVAGADVSPTSHPLPLVNVFRPDRKSTRLNSSHIPLSRMPSSA